MEWLKNDEPLRNVGEKSETLGHSSSLKIHAIDFADTGAYMCQASSIGGAARDISSLVVQQDAVPRKTYSITQFFLTIQRILDNLIKSRGVLIRTRIEIKRKSEIFKNPEEKEAKAKIT